MATVRHLVSTRVDPLTPLLLSVPVVAVAIVAELVTATRLNVAANASQVRA